MTSLRPRRIGSVYRSTAVALALVGAALRLVELQSYSFWIDESWVALSTRVESFSQWWLSLSTTPVGWAIALRVLSLAPGPPEISLRLVALAFGLAAMPAAYALGRRLGGHELGGLLALGVIALDPSSIAFSKTLKQYSAEAFFAVLSFEAAARVAGGAGGHSLRRLIVVLAAGALFANSQVLVAPALIAALVLDAALRRDRAGLRRRLVAGGAVTLVIAIGYTLVTAPHIPPAMRDYWRDAYLPLGSAPQALDFAAHAFDAALAPPLGRAGAAVAVAALLLATVRDRILRTGAVALGLLTVELVGLAALRRFPLGAERLLLFYSTVFAAIAAAAIARLARPLASRLPPVVVAGAAVLLVLGPAARHDWRVAARQPVVEDLGPLVHQLEAERGPDDVLLLYQPSAFAFAFYGNRTPRLVPAPTTVGFWPSSRERGVQVVTFGDAVAAAEPALRAGRRVWFLGSHLREGDAARLRADLVARADLAGENRRRGAVLLRIDPPRP